VKTKKRSKNGALRRDEGFNRVGAFITGWTVGRLLQSIEGVK